MIEVMIADDNIRLSSQMANILTKEKKIKIVKIANNGLDAINSYNALKPNVLLLDLDMPFKNGLDVIQELSLDEEEQNKRNIIVISGSMVFRSQISNPSRIKWIFSKPVDYDRIVEEIISIDENERIKPLSQNNIDDLFSKLNIKSYTKGAKYLKDAISIAYYEQPNPISLSNIAKTVAMKNKIPITETILSNMDKTISSMYYKHADNQSVIDIFHMSEKPSTKDFITYAIDFINDQKKYT
ncbi:MAG: response regulator [Clostridia bacterium]|nr:response regulator [Clostridia bacterium]